MALALAVELVQREARGRQEVPQRHSQLLVLLEVLVCVAELGIRSENFERAGHVVTAHHVQWVVGLVVELWAVHCVFYFGLNVFYAFNVVSRFLDVNPFVVACASCWVTVTISSDETVPAL